MYWIKCEFTELAVELTPRERMHDFRDSIPVQKLNDCSENMQKFRAKQAISVIAFKAKAIYNIPKSQ